MLTLQTWPASSDVDLGVPKWVVEVLQARLRWHLEEYTFGTYHGSVVPHQVCSSALCVVQPVEMPLRHWSSRPQGEV